MGLSRTKTYKAWYGMLYRCNNSKNDSYHCYGGRGITVCSRWLTFANFLADMGEAPVGLSLDRIDNDGNYEPGNCRWATLQEQAANRAAHHHRPRDPRTMCIKGLHELTPDNTYLHCGDRLCKACRLANQRRNYKYRDQKEYLRDYYHRRKQAQLVLS